VYQDPITEEIREVYCRPLGIQAMMDIPLRIDGETVGVLCFEESTDPRVWSPEEQQFGLSVAQVVSLAIESHRRRESETELRKLLLENKILMSEMHHRIKNNLSMLISLLRLQCDEAQLDETRSVLRDSQNRISSIMRLHEHLYKAGNYLAVNLPTYFSDIISEYEHSKPSNVRFKSVLPQSECQVEISKAVIIGLFISEAISNCFKHAFPNRNGEIVVGLENNNGLLSVFIRDNGIGFISSTTTQSNSSLGLNLMHDMAEQIDASFEINHLANGTEIRLTFPVKVNSLN
jgi:two-component sensor histidine kinase